MESKKYVVWAPKKNEYVLVEEKKYPVSALEEKIASLETKLRTV